MGRMTGKHVLYRNFASDQVDNELKQFFNKDSQMDKIAFYSAGKRNSFHRNYKFVKRGEHEYYKGTNKSFVYPEKLSSLNELPGGDVYYSVDGYHKMDEKKWVNPLPMNIYLDLNYIFNYLCDTKEY